MSKIDTRIGHITKAGSNLFSELGFSQDDAKRLQTQSRDEIDHCLLLKEQLMEELACWIRKKQLKQAEAADILQVTRPRISDVVNRKTGKFTIDALVNMLGRIGRPVKLMIG